MGTSSRDRKFDFVVFASFLQAIADHLPASNAIAAMSQPVRSVSAPVADVDRLFDALIAKQKAAIAEVLKTSPEPGIAEDSDFGVWGKEFKGAWVSRESF